MDCTGEFKGSVESSYEYKMWSNVDIRCVQYSTFIKIMEAITPIIEEEKEQMKKHYGKVEE